MSLAEGKRVQKVSGDRVIAWLECLGAYLVCTILWIQAQHHKTKKRGWGELHTLVSVVGIVGEALTLATVNLCCPLLLAKF